MKYLLFIFISALSMMGLRAQSSDSLNEKEAQEIGIDAYIYGYPLVTMATTKEIMTNAEVPNGLRGPVGQFVHVRIYPTVLVKDIVAPNADTLYSTAWLDLSDEPYVLHVPNEEGRFYLMSLLSGWTNVIDAIGTRATGTEAADYVITGPNWKGELPTGLKEVKSPTNMVWIVGQTYGIETPEDYQLVHNIQDQYKLTPLSYFDKYYRPHRGKIDSSLDMKTPVRDQVDKMDAATFFNKLALLMKDNPPTSEDAPIIARMAKIGIVPGQPFDPSKLDSKIVGSLQQVPKSALAKIVAHQKDAGQTVNGWTYSLKTGSYGTDYLQRAYVAAVGLGANLPQDAIYPTTEVDSEGKSLNGANHYVIHFDKEQLPPVKGFWALSMYNDKYIFIDNPLNRYTIGQRNPLKFNTDGSLDLYIQNESPGPDKESNWLPAPKDHFILMLRLYWPEKAILEGTWKPPAVKQIK